MSFNDIVRVCSLISVTKTNSMFYELQNNTPSAPTLSSGGTASSYEGWYISRVQYSSYIMLNTFQRCPQKKRNVLREDDTRLCGYRRGGRRQKKIYLTWCNIFNCCVQLSWFFFSIISQHVGYEHSIQINQLSIIFVQPIVCLCCFCYCCFLFLEWANSTNLYLDNLDKNKHPQTTFGSLKKFAYGFICFINMTNNIALLVLSLLRECVNNFVQHSLV